MKHVMAICFMFLVTACASGYAPGEYVPITVGDIKGSFNDDLDACYDAHKSFVGPRPDYRASVNECLQKQGHLLDVAASNAKYEAIEAERKKRLTDKAKKSGGY
ncbi:hypothetical protein [Kordiimonas aquimaris]|uniref:hypothetical protein n=1 Tax=Kordiimonas aquimaris TaxID=707591 RepID=UPI0021D0D6BF|nr:hypothetical protein [Kordiimonas aquimaris]